MELRAVPHACILAVPSPWAWPPTLLVAIECSNAPSSSSSSIGGSSSCCRCVNIATSSRWVRVCACVLWMCLLGDCTGCVAITDSGKRFYIPPATPAAHMSLVISIPESMAEFGRSTRHSLRSLVSVAVLIYAQDDARVRSKFIIKTRTCQNIKVKSW